MHTRLFTIISAALLTIASSPALAQSGTKKSAAPAPRVIRVDVAGEKVDAEPTRFVPVVGHWVVVRDEGRKVVMVDGRAWKRGQPAGGLADKARSIYGARHEEFIDNVKAFAYFPVAIAKDVPDFTNGEIAVRFKMIGGALDRCAGIVFDVKPNGVLWTFNGGKRAFVKRGDENVPLELGTWHELKVAVHGTQLTGYLDGRKLLEHTLAAPVSGKVGLWSKTDSMSEFTGFTVTPAAQ